MDEGLFEGGYKLHKKLIPKIPFLHCIKKELFKFKLQASISTSLSTSVGESYSRRELVSNMRLLHGAYTRGLSRGGEIVRGFALIFIT